MSNQAALTSLCCMYVTRYVMTWRQAKYVSDWLNAKKTNLMLSATIYSPQKTVNFNFNRIGKFILSNSQNNTYTHKIWPTRLTYEKIVFRWFFCPNLMIIVPLFKPLNLTTCKYGSSYPWYCLDFLKLLAKSLSWIRIACILLVKTWKWRM